ncbi:hypothetical protein PMIN06_005785 [Paraphaeosphaeria minitans]
MFLIVIVGINGRQGSSVAEAFMDVPGTRIRGLTSSPMGPASQRWQERGVEIREEMFDDEKHIKDSFKGATIIFAITSYHKFMQDRRAKLIAEIGFKRSVREIAIRQEVQVGRMILDAAATTPGLQKLVMSTFPVTSPGNKHASHTAQGTYLAKREHIRYMGRCLPALAAKTVLVKPCMPMEDFQATLRMVSSACV